VVDVYGAVTSVSLCSPVIDLSQSATATISHSVTNVLTPTDDTSGIVCCEHSEDNDITAAALVSLRTVLSFVNVSLTIS